MVKCFKHFESTNAFPFTSSAITNHSLKIENAMEKENGDMNQDRLTWPDTMSENFKSNKPLNSYNVDRWSCSIRNDENTLNDSFNINVSFTFGFRLTFKFSIAYRFFKKTNNSRCNKNLVVYILIIITNY